MLGHVCGFCRFLGDVGRFYWFPWPSWCKFALNMSYEDRPVLEIGRDLLLLTLRKAIWG